MMDRRTHLFVRIPFDFVADQHVACRDIMEQLAALCFVQSSSLQSTFHHMQFHFAQHSLQPQNETVIDVIRIVHAIVIDQ